MDYHRAARDRAQRSWYPTGVCQQGPDESSRRWWGRHFGQPRPRRRWWSLSCQVPIYAHAWSTWSAQADKGWCAWPWNLRNRPNDSHRRRPADLTVSSVCYQTDWTLRIWTRREFGSWDVVANSGRNHSDRDTQLGELSPGITETETNLESLEK